MTNSLLPDNQDGEPREICETCGCAKVYHGILVMQGGRTGCSNCGCRQFIPPASSPSSLGSPTAENMERAIEIGLEAAYKVRANNYLGANLEARVRAGIVAAFQALHEAPSPQHWTVGDTTQSSVTLTRKAPSGSPPELKELSIICRHCGTLQSGVEAGRFVKWVVCPRCDASEIKELRAAFSSLKEDGLTAEEARQVIFAIGQKNAENLEHHEDPLFAKLRRISQSRVPEK